MSETPRRAFSTMADTLSSLTGPPILFADLDGTVRHGKDELGRFVNSPGDVTVFAEAVTRLRAWRDAGGVTVGVTNQAGIALGHCYSEDLSMAYAETQRQCDKQLDIIFACEHHPDAGCFCRKPLPGLLLRGAEWVGRMRTAPDRRSCLMVGDRPEDEQAAAAASVPFQWAAEWRAGDAPMPDLTVRRHDTGVEVAQDRPGASVVLFWCHDRRVWLSGSRTDDHALTFGPIPLALPTPDGETDDEVTEDAKRIATEWFGRKTYDQEGS